MTRPSFTKWLGLLSLFIPLCWFSVVPVAAQNFNIKPSLSCIDVDEATNTVTAYFGYESFERTPIELPVGATNRFLPNPADRGGPTIFYPGLHERAFRATFPADGFLAWGLLGTTVSVTVNSPRCAPPAPKIIPFVERVTVNGNTATATFGYFNNSTTAITISRGNVLNHFSVGQQDRGQPETFQPGLQRNVFSVTFDITAEPALVWLVHGLPALAVPNSTVSCPIITIRAP